MALTQVPIELSSTPGIVDNSNATAITIDANENVGIGTSSPASLLDVSSTGSVVSTIRSTSTSGARGAKLRLNVASTGGDDPAGTIEFTYGTGYTVAGSIAMSHSNNAMRFSTGTTERMRIDSSGNVGIGLTNPSAYYAENLVVAAADEGGITIECGSTEKAYFMFARGTSGSDAYRSYVGYDHGNDSMNIVSSGYINFYTDDPSTEKMRILSTGGITFNGDTAQANALDDYEEGTWTMGLSTAGGGFSASITNTTGTYTKVGNIVNVRIYTGGVNVTAAGSGTAQITGLPFTVSNSGNANSNYSAASFAHTNIFSTTYESYAAIGQNYAVVTQVGSINSAAFATGNPKYMMFTLTYKTDA